MSLLVFQHHPAEHASRLGVILQQQGHRLRVVRLFDNQPVPVDMDDVDGIVSLGGPMNVEDKAKHAWIEQEMAYLKTAHEAGKPIVGICLGAQLIAAALGGEVAAMAQPEVGWHGIRQAFPGTIDTIYGGIMWDSVQFHLHGQEVTKLPPGGTPLSGSKLCRTQAYKVGLKTYAFQYHFEWTREEIKQFANDPIVTRGGSSADAIIKATEEHYDTYRRLGDRLSETIATMLFPIDKR